MGIKESLKIRYAFTQRELEGEEIKMPKHTARRHIKLKIQKFVAAGIGSAAQQC